MSAHESTEELTRADAEARAESVRHFDAPLMLEAGAGTGKTTTLVARIVAWALGPGWSKHATEDEPARRVLRGIKAITFTEAAAGEMAQRVAEALAQVAGGELPRGFSGAELPDETERAARAAALLERVDTLQLTTIHAFCAGLLRRFSLAAGLHPRAEVDAEEERVVEVLTELVEERLGQVFGDPGDRDWVALARAGFGPTDVADGLLALHRAGARAEDLDGDPLAAERIAGLLDELKAGLLPLSLLLDFDPKAFGRATKAKAARETLQLLAAEVSSADLELLELVEGRWEAAGGDEPGADWAAVLIDRLKAWSKGDFNGGETAAFGDAGDAVAQHARTTLPALQHLASLDVALLAVGHAVLAPLYRELRRRLVRAGVLSFDDLLAESVALLERSEVALGQLREDLEFLAVDEFQDTDARQCRLVELLALEGPAAERPALFVVGDPKQSIYGWRAADLAAYEGFKARLVAAGGSVRPLSVNYRSDDRILREVGRVMEGAMAPEPGLQPEFQPLVAGRGEFAGPGARCVTLGWHPDGAGQDAPKRAELVRREAAWVAGSIRGWLEELRARGEQVGFGDVALLLRSTGDLERYLDAFKRCGVPFAVARDKSYYRRREVIEAAALVRCVLDPRDQVALVTWARSGAVGVPDAALLPLWTAGLPTLALGLGGPGGAGPAEIERLVQAAAEAVPAAAAPDELPRWPALLRAALEDLAALRRAFEELSADRFTEVLRARTLLEVTERARFLGAYREANLERFFRQLAQAIEEGGGDRARSLRKLRESVAQALEAEEGRPREADRDAVQIMTVHKSKGLDFRIVVLGQLYKERVARGGGPAFAFAHTPPGPEFRAFGCPSLGWHRVTERARDVEAFEAVRLLYVAMTRAKDHLVLAANQPFAGNARTARDAKSLEQLLASRQPGVPEPQAGAEAEVLELDDGVARVAIQEPEAPAAVPANEDAAPAAAARAAARARRDADAIDARRRQAEARAERPRFATASSAAGSWSPDDGAEHDDERRPWAAELGTCIHRLLERVALGRLAPADLRAAAEPRFAELAARRDPGAAAALRARGAELLERLQAGPFPAELAALGERCVATELPILLRAEDGAEGPLVGYTGVLDLLYRDAAGNLVVVDHKTDPIADDARLAQLTAAYRPQVELYARALARALELDAPPACELWMLDRGERVVL